MTFPVPDTLTLQQALDAPYLPGHQRGEQVVVKEWLRQEGAAYQAFGFNVRLGQGVTAPEDAPDYAKRFVTKTTQKRVDIVAFHSATVSLFEVKIQANLGALGQMLGYKHLWEIDYPAWPVARYGILCHLISLDTAAVFTKHGMPFYLFADIQLPPLPTLPLPQ